MQNVFASQKAGHRSFAVRYDHLFACFHCVFSFAMIWWIIAKMTKQYGNFRFVNPNGCVIPIQICHSWKHSCLVEIVSAQLDSKKCSEMDLSVGRFVKRVFKIFTTSARHECGDDTVQIRLSVENFRVIHPLNTARMSIGETMVDGLHMRGKFAALLPQEDVAM